MNTPRVAQRLNRGTHLPVFPGSGVEKGGYGLKITILYDNTVWRDNLVADWGFACLVEACGTTILFDTGAKGPILLDNMKKLNIDPNCIEDVVISHGHWDHTGGLVDFLSGYNDIRLFVPSSYAVSPHAAKEVIAVRRSIEIADNVYSTGELKGIEQALVVNATNGVVVIVGCSHPGVKDIVNIASQYGNVVALIGGLHGFNEFDIIRHMGLICATHCTQHIPEIRSLFPDTFMAGEAGRLIEL
jgi:7,8-dihydropterin-6-yl-methyl-4-(beta-D-ribofuranosyl)aminobenzene 5'-phosphate synthase